jgi:hypothetical protein
MICASLQTTLLVDGDLLIAQGGKYRRGTGGHSVTCQGCSTSYTHACIVMNREAGNPWHVVGISSHAIERTDCVYGSMRQT